MLLDAFKLKNISLKQMTMYTGWCIQTSWLNKKLNDTQKSRERNPNKTLKEYVKPQGSNQENLRTEENYKNNQKTVNKMAISIYLPITTLNANELNYPVKRYRVT